MPDISVYDVSGMDILYGWAVACQVGETPPTMESLIQGRVAYGRLFLPRARRLMEAQGQVYPEAFEVATKQYLWETLGLSL